MHRYLILIACICILVSCKPYGFLPILNVNPQLSEVNEFQAGINTGIGSNLSASYSPFNHFGIAVNGYHMGWDSTLSDSNSIYRKRLGAAFSVGYYYLTKESALFELYGGVEFGKNRGYGNLEDFTVFTNRNKSTYVNNRYISTFLNPSVSVIKKDVIGGIGVRFSRNQFVKDESQIIVKNVYDSSIAVRYYPTEYPSVFYMAVPTIYIKAGGKNVKGIFQFGFPMQIAGNGFDNIKSKLFYPFVFNFGLEVRLFANKGTPAE